MFHLDFVILLLVITVNLSQLLAGFVAELLNPIMQTFKPFNLIKQTGMNCIRVNHPFLIISG